MVFYEANITEKEVLIRRLELATKGAVIRTLNRAAGGDSIDHSIEDIGVLSGYMYGGTKKEIVSSIHELFKDFGISMRRVTINWQQEEEA